MVVSQFTILDFNFIHDVRSNVMFSLKEKNNFFTLSQDMDVVEK